MTHELAHCFGLYDCLTWLAVSYDYYTDFGTSAISTTENNLFVTRYGQF